MKLIVKLLFVPFCLFAASPVYSAQEEKQLDNSDYSYGEVVSVAEQTLSVIEYDYDMDEERAVDYGVTIGTGLTNIKKVTDLVPGDTVEVYFKETDGTKTALMIIKDDNVNSADDPVDDSADDSADDSTPDE